MSSGLEETIKLKFFLGMKVAFMRSIKLTMLRLIYLWSLGSQVQWILHLDRPQQGYSPTPCLYGT